MSKLRVWGIQVSQQPPSKLRVWGVSLSKVEAAVPSLGPDQTVASLSTVSLTATVTGSPSAWSWSYVSQVGATITLAGSGNTRSFTAPATYDGDLITVTATATIGGVDTSGSVVIAVIPHQRWVLRSGVWKAAV